MWYWKLEVTMFIKHLGFLLVIHCTYVRSSVNMEGFIVGGKEADILDYPHSVFLAIECVRSNIEQFACGGSIVTQSFIVTAGHCFYGCDPERFFTVAAVGSTQHEGVMSRVTEFRVHENFKLKNLINDIALLRLQKPLKFGQKVQKVYLMQNPPEEQIVDVAGWGMIDEATGQESLTLKEASQKILPREECIKILGFISKTAFCANSLGGYAAEGDSGSGLVAQKFILIGIVSHKNSRISASLVVYTNASTYYDWIKTTIADMACSDGGLYQS